jgi:hypothetical protein
MKPGGGCASVAVKERKRSETSRPHRLGGPGRPEAEHGDAPAGVSGHRPDRRHPPFVTGDRLAVAGARIEAGEVEDAVLQRADAGHHRRPYQRRQRRLDRGEHPRLSFARQRREVRHDPGRHVAVEQLPVRAVETDKEDAVAGVPGRSAGCPFAAGHAEKDQDDQEEGREKRKESAAAHEQLALWRMK